MAWGSPKQLAFFKAQLERAGVAPAAASKIMLSWKKAAKKMRRNLGRYKALSAKTRNAKFFDRITERQAFAAYKAEEAWSEIMKVRAKRHLKPSKANGLVKKTGQEGTGKRFNRKQDEDL